MNINNTSSNSKIRRKVLEPIVFRINSDSQFRQQILKIYDMALVKTVVEFPDLALSEIIYKLMPSELKSLELNHDEILQIIMLTKIAEVSSGKSGQIELHPEFTIKHPDKDVKYWVDRGYQILKQGLYINAIRSFNKALSIDANHEDALYLKGFSLFKLAIIGSKAFNTIWSDFSNPKSMIHEAVQCYKKVLGINSKHADAWFGIGACLIEIGRFSNDFSKVQEAINCFKMTLSIDPHNEDAKKAIKSCKDSM